jgi:hypothetical protein
MSNSIIMSYFLGGVEMENTMDKLKDLQRHFSSLKKTIESKSKNLDQETIDNQRLEGEVMSDHLQYLNE